MTDVFTKAKRSEVMSKIKGRNTVPERVIRSLLHKNGYRFRLHRAGLPGKPDIVLPRYKVAIFVHGCFWHRHNRCKFAYTPKTRPEFWLEKLTSNTVRDRRTRSQLVRLGWRVIVVWECQLRYPERVEKQLTRTMRGLPQDKATKVHGSKVL